MTELATTLEKKRDYAEAARYAEYALDIRTVTLGTKHPSFAAAAKLAASLCAKNADHIAARDRFHMAAVRLLPCLLRRPTDSHHLHSFRAGLLQAPEVQEVRRQETPRPPPRAHP